VISPDGRTIAFTANDRDGHHLLWIRSLDSSSATPLPGTDDALMPFWSPDSHSMAFAARGKLKRLELAGTTITDLCDAPRLTGGAWNKQGIILFSPDYGSPLYTIPATGGTPVVASRNNPGEPGQYWNPVFLPDGKHFLFMASVEQRGDSLSSNILPPAGYFSCGTAQCSRSDSMPTGKSFGKIRKPFFRR
jgi:Tol biopolymer transport system component